MIDARPRSDRLSDLGEDFLRIEEKAFRRTVVREEGPSWQ